MSGASDDEAADSDANDDSEPVGSGTADSSRVDDADSSDHGDPGSSDDDADSTGSESGDADSSTTDLVDSAELRDASDAAPPTGLDDRTGGERIVSLPACPHCETPVAMVTTRGPDDARATPCGCRVRGDLLETD